MQKIQILTLLLATGLALATKPLPQADKPMKPTLAHTSLAQTSSQPGRWITLNTGTTVNGRSSVLSFDSTNSHADYRIYDSGFCKLRSFINGLFYSFDFEAPSQLACSQGIIAKLDPKGQVLFIDPSFGSYRYVTSTYAYSQTMTVSGFPTLTQLSAAGVDIAVTKTHNQNQQNFDGFRVYSKASDTNQNYPLNFYSLISDSFPNAFIIGKKNSLKLKETNWLYKKTSNKAQFDTIEAVNFIPVHGAANNDEGQFIFGQYRGQNSCLFGVVDTYRYFEGTASYFQMYAGNNNNQAFSCGSDKTYQGLIVQDKTPLYSYAIETQSGQLRVCSGLPSTISAIKDAAGFGNSCQTIRKPQLTLRQNEYYSAVNIEKIGKGLFGVVSVRTKGDGVAFRQVYLNLGAGALPTFDIDTYFYTVAAGKIWRMSKKFNGGYPVQISYFVPSGASQTA